MSDQEIIEGNKLIAEFMGYEIPKQTHNLNWIMYKDLFQPMQFHSSWDWLMSAVEKIEGIENNIQNESREDFRHFQKVLSLPIYTKIKVTWLSVIEFIKWYNSRKLK